MTIFAYDAHIFTEIVILILWAALPLYTYLTFRRSGRSVRTAAIIGSVILVWGLWAFGVVRYEIDSFLLGWLPTTALKVPFYIFLSLGVAFALRKRLVGDGLSQRWLLGLQTVRVIGLLFIVEFFRGNLPASFAFPAGLGDFLTAVFAIAVLVRYRGQAIPKAAIYFIVAFGMIDFASAIFFGVTSSETVFQLFAFNRPNQVILYPTGLIPFFAVPLAAIFHMLSILELWRSSASVESAPAAIGHTDISLSPTS